MSFGERMLKVLFSLNWGCVECDELEVALSCVDASYSSAL